MTPNDRIGNHGEFVFQVLISRMCRRKFYFHPIPMGEKHPAVDMMVELHDTTKIRSFFIRTEKVHDARLYRDGD